VRAIDTNILVRFLADPDTEQAQCAREVMAAGDIFIGVTVLLETEWVLRTGYKFTRSRTVEALKAVSGLPGIHVEDSECLGQVLDWTEKGMDFADALHVARAIECSEFLSFDRKLAKLAVGLIDTPVTSP
jgi:predicted nucleic-acid-binding protein